MIVDIKNLLQSSVSPLVQKIFNKSLHNSAIFSMSTCSFKSILGVISEGQQLKLWNHTNEWKAISNFDFEE